MAPEMQLLKLTGHAQHIALLAALAKKTAYITIVQICGPDAEDLIVSKASAVMELLEQKPVRRWLGTVTRGKPAQQYTYRAEKAFFAYLRTFEAFFVNETDSWGCERPRKTDFGLDDIAFLDHDRRPLFYTTTHEGYACLSRAIVL